MTEMTDKNLQTVFVAGLKNIFNYKDRASKYDYWGFLFANILVAMLAMVLILGFAFVTPIISSILLVAYYAYSIVAFFAVLALVVRRLHDINHSGKILWLMLGLLVSAIMGAALGIPLSDLGYSKIGMSLFVVSLIAFVAISLRVFVISMYRGQKEDNKYGKPVEEAENYNEKANIYIVLYLVIKFVFGGVNVFLSQTDASKEILEDASSELAQNVAESEAADSENAIENAGETEVESKKKDISLETPNVPLHESAE